MVEKNSGLSLQKQCELLELNRSSYYYQSVEHPQDSELVAALHQIHESQPFYGYRKVTHCLKENGFKVGKKRVQRLKRLLGLKTLYPQSKTTRAHPEHKKYPYLLRNLPITRPNQVWCADISYIPVGRSHVYLVAIMDWYSRKILAYRISNTMDKSFCVEALQEVLSKYGPPEIFNTDQGCQFTSHEFTGCLQANGIAISMDGKGRCLDNVVIERWFRSLKYEEVYLKGYLTVAEAKSGIAEYVRFYNHERYHASLGYLRPEQVYEQGLDTRPIKGVMTA